MKVQNRSNAACAAALTGCGPSTDDPRAITRRSGGDLAQSRGERGVNGRAAGIPTMHAEWVMSLLDERREEPRRLGARPGSGRSGTG